MRPFDLLPLTIGLAIVSGIEQAHAAPINYGDFAGNNVIYRDVTETANTPGDTEPLFGPPTIASNSLGFLSASFAANASAQNTDITDGQLNFTVEAIRGHVINNIAASESGAYTLQGTNGKPLTQIGYALSLASVTVLEVDGAPLATPVPLNPISTSGLDKLDQGSDTDTPWSLAVWYDVDTALAQVGLGYTFGATKLELVIDNLLSAISGGDSLASIEKDSLVIDVNVPAPSVPTLTIVRGGPDEVIVSWTPDPPGWFLQESMDLNPTMWSNAPSGPTNPVIIPTTVPRQFYRLIKP